MNKQDIKWAPVIPLVGGLPIGAEQAIGHGPKTIYGYDGFWSNDRHYVNYQQNTKNHKVEYVLINDSTPPDNLDLVVSTPPCAGLSMLNTSSADSENRCAKNEWMMLSTEFAMTKLNAKVILGENAPGLYTTRGKDVVDSMLDLCRKHGYKLTLYKTNTKYHGIPQNRERTFYFFWKSEDIPLLNYYRMPYVKFHEFFDQAYRGFDLKNDVMSLALSSNKMVERDLFWNYIKDVQKLYPRDAVGNDYLNTLEFCVRKNLMEDVRKYAKESGNPKFLHKIEHYFEKRSRNKGIWDDSTKVFLETCNAIISKNIASTLHATEDRSLTVRDVATLMGMPLDYQLLPESNGRYHTNLLCQNVPVCTAKSMTEEALRFLNGECQMLRTSKILNKQSNSSYSPDKNQSNLDDFLLTV